MDPHCTLDELPLRLSEDYGVASVMEEERCRVSLNVTVQWHGQLLGIGAYACAPVALRLTRNKT